MTAIARLFSPPSQFRELRPFDPRRDMYAVADLIEIGFAESLDIEGERYVRQLREAASNPGLFGWGGLPGFQGNIPHIGYVWEEGGRVVGNLSLIPFLVGARHNFLIANVVVHPNFRRIGIGRNLTAQGIEHARKMGALSVWLHVKEENEGAIALYRSLGFEERARRATWQSVGDPPPLAKDTGLVFGPRRARHWPQQRSWLVQNYPPEVTWHLPLRFNSLRPGLAGGFYRIVQGQYITQWSVEREGRLLGVVAWQSLASYANAFWLAVPGDEDEAAVRNLLLFARSKLPSRRALMLDYPAGQSNAAISEAGFKAHQTLIWMAIFLGGR